MPEDEIDLMGYTRITCKSDQDSNIQALKEAVKIEWAGAVIMEESPVGEHQAHGRVERALQSIQCMIRTIRYAFERIPLSTFTKVNFEFS